MSLADVCFTWKHDLMRKWLHKHCTTRAAAARHMLYCILSSSCLSASFHFCLLHLEVKLCMLLCCQLCCLTQPWYVVQLSLCLIKKPAKVIYAVKAHAVVVTTVMLGGVVLLLYKVISGADVVLQVRSHSATACSVCQGTLTCLLLSALVRVDA